MNDQFIQAFTRRRFFGRVANGLMGIALSDLWRTELQAAENSGTKGIRTVADLKPKAPHFRPRAKSVIQLFMHGGPSQMDLFDPKPLLHKYAGKPFPGDINVQEP